MRVAGERPFTATEIASGSLALFLNQALTRAAVQIIALLVKCREQCVCGEVQEAVLNPSHRLDLVPHHRHTEHPLSFQAHPVTAMWEFWQMLPSSVVGETGRCSHGDLNLNLSLAINLQGEIRSRTCLLWASVSPTIKWGYINSYLPRLVWWLKKII